MRRITSALFLDFDNIFSRLLSTNRVAAMALVADPGLFVERLRMLDAPNGVTRDVLVRRAYLNPNGTIPDPSGPPAETPMRLPISEYRMPFTQAGFEVIDCPRLAKGLKNGADIRIVIDVMDAMVGPVRYDEVILASSDADFSPLLVKLRASDRRTMLLTTGTIASAYSASADRCIDEAELTGLLTPTLTPVERPRPITPKRPSPSPTPKQPGPEDQAVRALVDMLRASSTPVALSAAGSALRREVGNDVVNETMWFGHKTLTRFVRERVTNLKVDPTSVWDPARHGATPASATAKSTAKSTASALAR